MNNNEQRNLTSHEYYWIDTINISLSDVIILYNDCYQNTDVAFACTPIKTAFPTLKSNAS